MANRSTTVFIIATGAAMEYDRIVASRSIAANETHGRRPVAPEVAAVIRTKPHSLR
jgi:hypothetical protein